MTIEPESPRFALSEENRKKTTKECLPGKQFSASYLGNMTITMGNFRVLVPDWLKDVCYPRVTPLLLLVTGVILGSKVST